MDAYAPYWHEVKNPIAVEIGLLHLQQNINIHLHFLTFVESATSQMLLPQ
jgi:hypothetical protein